MARMNAATKSTDKKDRASTPGGWALAALLACSVTVISGCAGLATTSSANPTPQEAVQISPSDITFSNVPAGQKMTQTATLTNTGSDSVTITQVASSSTQFATSGIRTPLTIAPGQSARFQVVYTGSTTASTSGTLSAMTSRGGSSTKVKLRGWGTKTASQLSLSTTALNFGSVLVNGSSTQSVTLKNSGQSDVQITQLGVTGGGFAVSGVSAPVTLPAGQAAVLQATFAPTSAGTSSGAITVSSDAVNSTSTVALSGTAVGASYTMSLSPAAVSFGNVNVGNSATQNVQVSNTGNSSVTLTQVTASGSGISVSGIATPVTVAPSQSVALTVKYSPAGSGAIAGSITVANNQGVNAAAAVTGTGVQAGISVTPASANFGSVVTGNTSSQTIQIKNSGTASLTIAQATVSGTGFSLSGLALPQTLAPGQASSLNVQYAPPAAGAASGSVSIVSDAPNSPSAVALSGTGVQAGISVTPASANFGSVVAGNTNSQTIQIKNSGTASLTIAQATVSGTGFSLSGLALPQTLAPGQASSFNVQYAPPAAGAASGSVSIASDAPNSPAAVALSGTGVAATYTLGLSPSSLSFGSVTNGSNASQTFTVTNTGNSNVAISGMSVTGTGYSLVSGAGAITLSPNQSNSVSVQFAPATAGTANGSVNILSNATGSASSVSLSGTGVAPVVSHSVDLNWGASTSSIAGYNVYRSSVSGSSYAKLNGSPVNGVNYADSNVQSGQTYFYVATSVDASGNESVYSNEVTAVVP